MRHMAVIGAALIVAMVWGMAAAARPSGNRPGPGAVVEHAKRMAQKPDRGPADQYRPTPRDHDRTLDDFRHGRIRPFSEIRRRVVRQIGGRIIDAELDRYSKPWVYKVRVLTDDGNVLAVRLDAQSGRILKVTGQKKR
ncbi:MAG: PepSY domain-containing protein [Sphingomonadales bacterium]